MCLSYSRRQVIGMEAAAGAIRFDIALDLGKIKTAIDETSQKLNEKFTGAFTGAAKKCQSECNHMAGAFKKVDVSVDETRKKSNQF